MNLEEPRGPEYPINDPDEGVGWCNSSSRKLAQVARPRRRERQKRGQTGQHIGKEG